MNDNQSASIVMFLPCILALIILGILVTAIGFVVKQAPIALRLLISTSNRINTADLINNCVSDIQFKLNFN